MDAAFKIPNDSWKPQEVANTAWALANLGYASVDIYQHLAAAAELYLAEFKSQELVNLVWALATAHWYKQRLLSKLCQAAAEIAHTFNAQVRTMKDS